MSKDTQTFDKRLEALRSEASTFRPVWMELSDYHLAHRGRFLVSDVNQGRKRNTKQINNTSHKAARTLASGMMSGITSPARPWFRLGTNLGKAGESSAVREWLHDVQTTMYQVFSHSNLYDSLHQVYSELGVFGMGALGVYFDYENVIWCKPYTIGSYYVGANERGEIDTFYREYELSVGQCVKKFGYDDMPTNIKTLWDNGTTEEMVKLVHAIEPNDDRDRNSPMARDKKFRSVYYERGNSSNGKKTARGGMRQEGSTKNAFLKRSGFDDFPIMVPRWDVTAEDVYATDSPGLTALGDTKSLQLAEMRKYQAIDKLVDPPLQGPASLKNKIQGDTLEAGEIVYHSQNGEGLRPVYTNYRPEINVIKQEIMDVENRIDTAFYADLFLMLANSDRRQITAREVAEKHEEKLLMLGPVLERLHNELLDPLIDRTFNILQEAGVFPVPPPELENTEVKVEYVSVLAQAQQMVQLGAVDRLVEFTGGAAQLWPEARHKIDINKAVDEYAESLGVDPSLIRSDDEVAAMVAADQEAAQRAQQAEAMSTMANTAKTASEIDTSEDSAVGAAMRRAGLA